MSDLEDDARRIADRGRAALVDRLRTAFRHAAQTERSEVSLDDAELEQMVRHAADEADGLQWRRALAAAAMDQLGLTLAEALEHPAVARAHEIVGAPSYERAVASLGLAPAKSDQEEAPVDPGTEERRGPTRPDVPERRRAPLEASVDAAQTRRSLQLVCTHLGGIADLASPEEGVELWFSEHGLDIIRPTKEPLGRLRWDELRAIEVVDARSRFALRRAPHTYLVIRGTQGDASFEVPHFTAMELRDGLESLANRKVPIV